MMFVPTAIGMDGQRSLGEPCWPEPTRGQGQGSEAGVGGRTGEEVDSW